MKRNIAVTVQLFLSIFLISSSLLMVLAASLRSFISGLNISGSVYAIIGIMIRVIGSAIIIHCPYPTLTLKNSFRNPIIRTFLPPPEGEPSPPMVAPNAIENINSFARFGTSSTPPLI